MNSFSKILAASAVVAGAFSLVPNALASTISFGSYVGPTAPTGSGFTDTPIVYGTTQATGSAVVAAPVTYATILPGTAFVSYSSSTNPGGNTTTNYFTTVNGGVAGETGTISVAADDTVQVFLNGVSIGNTVGTQYDTVQTFGFTLGNSNVFEFIVTNNPNSAGGTFNPTGLDFSGTATTPEPSSLILLGSGLVSAAGMIIRKRRA